MTAAQSHELMFFAVAIMLLLMCSALWSIALIIEKMANHLKRLVDVFDLPEEWWKKNAGPEKGKNANTGSKPTSKFTGAPPDAGGTYVDATPNPGAAARPKP